LAVAITVTEVPPANGPPPPLTVTVPPAPGEALAATVYCAALTVRVAVRLVWLKLMLPVYVPDLRLFALELIEKVMVVPDFVALPDVDDAVSQFGTLVIE
jgi:hypothetical protein